jgi:hypothetical protein
MGLNAGHSEEKMRRKRAQNEAYLYWQPPKHIQRVEACGNRGLQRYRLKEEALVAWIV